MQTYQIITDSTCDLTEQLVQELGVLVIPMEFMLDEQVYHNYPDGRELSCPAFYQALREGKMPRTTQINTAAFLEAFEPVLKQGRDILYIGFTSGLSATYERSCMAAKELMERYPERRIVAVDSRCASMGEGFLVELCVEQQRAGATLDEAAAWLEQNRDRMAHWITVDDLNHLKRGGRLSAASALVGSVLGIKPIIHVDTQGKLVAVDKVRGRRQSLDAIASRIAATAAEHPARIRIVHGDAPQDAQYVADRLREKLDVKDCAISYVGPIIGSHTGPGMVAAVAICTEK